MPGAPSPAISSCEATYAARYDPSSSSGAGESLRNESPTASTLTRRVRRTRRDEDDVPVSRALDGWKRNAEERTRGVVEEDALSFILDTQAKNYHLYEPTAVYTMVLLH
uniref:Uncharacterized protein n=1 Tax=Mycena chlorophos TaxID=658473 RepID=A0ABQ0LX74_MYCCL|nr:predicted protein [Mycena chlorophos]